MSALDAFLGFTRLIASNLANAVMARKVRFGTGFSVAVDPETEEATVSYAGAGSEPSSWFNNASPPTGYGVPEFIKVDVSENSSLRLAYSDALKQLTLSSVVSAAPSEWFDSALTGYGVPQFLKVDVSANSSLRVAYSDALKQLTLSAPVAASAPEWLNNAFPPVDWGNPSYIVVSATDFVASYDAPTKTLTLALPAQHRLDHEPVECVLLELPSTVTGGRALPTVEQADGWTLTTGERCLARDASGSVIGILRHDGAKLVEASDNAAARVAGHRVFAQHGRIFGHKTLRSRYGLSAYDWWVPLWICDSGPTWGIQKTVAASGSAAWVLLLQIPLAAETGVVHDVSLRACRWVTSTYASKRVYRAECTYFGDGTTVSAAPGMDPIVLHEAGETDIESRMKVTIDDGVVFVWGYRNASGGASWDYRAEATVIDDLLSRAL
jgi:hypothetical protein